MIRFIADIGSNHNQNIVRAMDLISVAAEIGCWGVKFQLFKGEHLYRNPTSEHLLTLKESELPVEFLPQLKECANKNGLAFGCTPFYLGACDILKPYLDFVKIGSYEILWYELIQEAALLKIPMMISTGMADPDEIWNAVMTALYHNPQNELVIFHCCSDYPASVEDCELEKIPWIKERMQTHLGNAHAAYKEISIGWSDHTTHPSVIYQAIACGAKTIEFHLDLPDMLGLESDYGHIWNPAKIGNVIQTVMEGQKAISTKYVFSTEQNLVKIKKRSERTDPRDGRRPLKVC